MCWGEIYFSIAIDLFAASQKTGLLTLCIYYYSVAPANQNHHMIMSCSQPIITHQPIIEHRQSKIKKASSLRPSCLFVDLCVPSPPPPCWTFLKTGVATHTHTEHRLDNISLSPRRSCLRGDRKKEKYLPKRHLGNQGFHYSLLKKYFRQWKQQKMWSGSTPAFRAGRTNIPNKKKDLALR